MWYDTVSSTNDVADRAAAAGAGHGTVVAADCQESGRGRMGRTWHSPPGAGLYVSVVLRPGDMGVAEGGTGVAAASRITLTAGVALRRGARGRDRAAGRHQVAQRPRRRAAKGVRDSGRGGQLRGRLRHVILGYGINVLAASYPPEIADRATSIEAELGRSVDRAAVFAESLACLAERLRQLSAGGFDAMLDTWRALSPTSTGARVEIVTPAAGPRR